jgi:hypothetical protein
VVQVRKLSPVRCLNKRKRYLERPILPPLFWSSHLRCLAGRALKLLRAHSHKLSQLYLSRRKHCRERQIRPQLYWYSPQRCREAPVRKSLRVHSHKSRQRYHSRLRRKLCHKPRLRQSAPYLKSRPQPRALCLRSLPRRPVLYPNRRRHKHCRKLPLPRHLLSQRALLLSHLPAYRPRPLISPLLVLFRSRL